MKALLCTLLVAFVGCARIAGAQAPAPGAQPGADSHDMALIGYDDPQGRSAYQPTLHQQGDRWIAYIGHHGGQALNPLTGQMEFNGTSVLDVTDPAHPLFIRDFGLPGQQPGSKGDVPPDLHGPISLGPAANRIYFAYGPGSNGILQIIDRQKLLNGPKAPTPDNLRYPQVGRLELSPLYGAHTSFPLGKMPIADLAGSTVGATRDLVLVVGESFKDNCAGPAQMALIVDATVESQPMVISSYTVPDPGGQFCRRGGRFGAHASNESFAAVFYKKLAFISWFNAGVRVLDIRDPYHLREAAHFIPAHTERTCAKANDNAPCKPVIQTNNVETDERGNIFIVDRANTGMHILHLTGEAAAIVGP